MQSGEHNHGSHAGHASHGATLCLCVDDFGLHAGVNDAVLRLVTMGRVHAVGCLVGAPAWPDGVPSIRRLSADGIDVGLHLDFTEHPLLPGSRRTLRGIIAASLARRLERGGLRAEIRAQLDTFEAALGRGPSFVDGHQHVHQLPGLRDELMAELQQRYTDHRPWIRCTRRVRPVAPSDIDAATRFKAAIIESLGARGLSRLAARTGFAQNRRLLGVYDFQGGPPRYRALLRSWLRAARNADLLMCHPGIGPRRDDPLIAARDAEYRLLSGPEVGELLQDGGIVLRPMSRILAPASNPG